ncbi:hypothetical protein PENTCL1PPCAC_12981 [Pristionchus entomophagus]|uniref:aralkylamine N-acetyltransferase n=1 Tax=Pristionchus entomophagus TaxID=358040 RepID=A0AAV5T5E7_9BILA|nr:hypothetical protein PENTCL1PPCAC_12981 [Pristionchus entomophagus]
MGPVTPSFATEADSEEILEFMLGDFLANESLNEALELQKEESLGLFKFLIRKGVKSGTSVLLRNQEGAMVGLRLSSFLDRNGEEETDENEEALQFSAKAEIIEELLEKLASERWASIPSDVNRVFYLIVLSVDSAYSRRGLGKVLLDYGMNRVIASGASAILSEATAMKSQALFAKHGYRVLKEVKHEDHVDKDGKRILTCPDGTNCAQLVFRYINNEALQ